jgi:hypothetical protein
MTRRDVAASRVDKAVVFGVGSDPKPDDAFVGGDAERAIPTANTDTPESPDVLEVQGGMTRILFQQ